MRLRTAWLALAVIAMLAASPIGAAAQGADGWVRLLEAGSGPVSTIAFSPDWPNDRLMLVRRGDTLVRSKDGGTSWEELGAWPADSLRIERLGSARVLLADGKTGIFRSTDDGASWQHVLPMSAELGGDLTLSPQFRDNGRALVRFGDRFYVSFDGGATWPELEPVPGQRVASARFWPDGGPDRDLYALVTSERYGLSGHLYRGGVNGWELVEPVKGRSVDRVLHGSGGRVILLLTGNGSPDAVRAVASLDNGSSWSPFADNLVVGDVTYRIDASALTPVMTDDGTVFVAAIGGPSSRLTLFRSDDGGATWTHLSGTPFESSPRLRADRSLDVSPQFATDRTALLVQSTSGSSPSEGACSIHRTDDGGETWAAAFGERRARCYVFSSVGPTGVTWSLSVSTPGGTFRSRSSDGGRTWTGAATDTVTGMAGATVIVSSPSFAQDGIQFAGTETGEIWARGPGLRAPTSQAACGTEPVDVFGWAWATDPACTA